MPRKQKVTPAARVIEMFGGIRPLARELGCNPNTVLFWRDRSKGGLIPSRWHRPLLDLARKRDKPLTPEGLMA